MKNPKTERARRLCCGAGFTLLEVLVAVLILALSVTAILYQFSMGMEAGGRARDATDAVLHAKEKMEELKAFIEEADEGRAGTFDDGCTWETRVELYDLPEKQLPIEENLLKFEMLKLTVVIGWTSGLDQRRYELTMLKAVRKKEQSG